MKLSTNSEQNSPEEAGEEIPVKIITDEKEPVLSETENSHPIETESDTLLKKLQRLQAEFANYKKRIDRERAEFAVEGQRRLLNSLLPILDDFDHLSNNTGGSDNITTGAKLIKNKLFSVLESNGLTKYAQVGESFNPEIHEAILVEESESDFDGKITEVLQTGYAFSGKILRVAKVKVGKTTDSAGSD